MLESTVKKSRKIIKMNPRKKLKKNFSDTESVEMEGKNNYCRDFDRMKSNSDLFLLFRVELWQRINEREKRSRRRK